MKEILLSLIPATFSLVGVIITCLVTGKATRDNMTHRLEVSQAVTETKIEELTREVRKHNDFAEKIPSLTERIHLIEHRLRDLEDED